MGSLVHRLALRQWIRSGLCMWLLVAACRAPESRVHEENRVAIPDAFAAETGRDALDIPVGPWWAEFGDPQLTALVERALVNNRDLQAAAARVAQAAALARMAGGELMPQAGVSLGAGRQRQNFVGFPIPGSGGSVLSTTSTSFGLSLDLSWELVLGGMLAARGRAADADWRASAAQVRGAQLSLAAQIAKAWFALAAIDLQLDLSRRRVKNATGSTRILRDRYAAGRIPALDLRASESELARESAALAASLETRERVTRQLEVLVGGYPVGLLEGSAQLPEIFGAVPAGLPSDLLERRPDLLAAAEHLRSLDLSLFESRKTLLPALSLTTSGGRRSAEASDLTSGAFDIWSLAANLTQPIFQGGRLRAGVDLADARVREGLANFEQTVLRAFLEVETALSVTEHQDERVASLERASHHAQASERLAWARYLAGRLEILSVLSARRAALAAETAWINARRERLDTRIDLFLALGGGFEDERKSASIAAPN